MKKYKNKTSSESEIGQIKLTSWKRAVIKVGSALITDGGRGCSTKHLLPLAGFIIESRNQKKEIIVVSSGAVASGLSTQAKLIGKKQRTIPEKQALAAIGQPLLMANWNRFFDFPCAQLLLTYDDIHSRKRFVNAKNTLMKLLEMGTLPIVNENDTVAVDELKVGDNDNLAAHVAVLAEADLLIICSDIDGLYDADPRHSTEAKLITLVEKIDSKIQNLAKGSQNPLATGGMKTKIAAAEKATSRGIDTIIINGTVHENFNRLAKGQVYGTLFRRIKNPIAGKKHWMLHGLPNAGCVIVDHGAANALCHKGASLLPSGILDVQGNFAQGDAVLVITQEKENSIEIAKGITQYGSRDLNKIKGCKSKEISSLLGFFISEEVIHRDDLVILDLEKG
jgi:glutamate 5-kinase